MNSSIRSRGTTLSGKIALCSTRSRSWKFLTEQNSGSNHSSVTRIKFFIWTENKVRWINWSSSLRPVGKLIPKLSPQKFSTNPFKLSSALQQLIRRIHRAHGAWSWPRIWAHRANGVSVFPVGCFFSFSERARLDNARTWAGAHFRVIRTRRSPCHLKGSVSCIEKGSPINSCFKSHRAENIDMYWQLNPLTPTSDQDRISPYIINVASSRQVMRVTKKIS